MSIAAVEKDDLSRKQASGHMASNISIVECSDRPPAIYLSNPGRPDQPPERKPVTSEPFIPEPLLDTDQAAAIMRIHPKTLQRQGRHEHVRGFQLEPF